jgi:hypothetical protein
VEGGEVTRFGGVDAVRSPSPLQPVWLVSKQRAIDAVPELNVLPDLMDAKHSLNVSGPAVSLQALTR